jgi:Zn-dependent protease with chaperone function
VTAGGASFPKPGLVTKEQRYRRRILLGLGALLVFSTSPVFGHHLPTGAEALLAGKDHLWALCLIALHMILEPVHLLFHGLFAAGFTYAVWDRVRAWRSLRQVLAPLRSRVPVRGEAFHDAACEAGVDPAVVRIVEGLPSPAFTAGWIWPRIYVARVLEDRLEPPELTAVLAHEAAHVRRRDPLRLSVLRFLTCTLFWVPGLRRLADDLGDETEIQADDVASRERPLALASAIVNLARWEVRNPAAGRVGFDDRDLLERRVKRLAGEDTPPRSRITRRSLMVAALALGLAWTSGAAVVHPFPGEVSHHRPEHCELLERSAISHLFCRGFPQPVHTDDCPHTSTAVS